MPRYGRAFRPGGRFFLTLVTEGRSPILLTDAARYMLHEAFNRSARNHPFTVDAIVLLPDHLHMVTTLPSGDADFAIRISQIKSAFTRSYLPGGGGEQARSLSRQRQRSRGIWLKRFWEHTIRDEEDLGNHFDYIHYNPVKHGYVKCPHAWPQSSFLRFVAQGRYPKDWRCQCERPIVGPVGFDEIAESAGE
jgi:putative transposase